MCIATCKERQTKKQSNFSILKFIIAIYILQRFALFFWDHLNFIAANTVFRLNFQTYIDNIFGQQ